MATKLSTEMWTEILLNEELTKESDVNLFQAIYKCKDHQANAQDIGLRLNRHHGAINLGLWRYAMRIAKRYNIKFTVRDDYKTKKYKFWDFFFYGWYEESFFIWQLKPELRAALENSGLVQAE